MANAGDVIFAIKTIWEGSAAFSEASKSAQKTKEKVDELGDSIRSASDQTKSMFKAFLGASAVQKGFSMLTNAVSGFINQSETMYKDHNVALTQLTNTMRNSMSASDAEIESILKLTEAQTKLGVVSTEVQLSGAKELSSYLQKKESLEKLIPVMNDMLAYQYGLSATQEQAANIAMLLGRVLDGQTGALSRNGYRFSEAQKEVLEYGNESERVAMLAEVISQTVEGVNESLAATPEGKVKQIANEYGHVQVEIGKLVTKIRGEATAVFKQVVVKLWENRNTILQVVKAVGVLTAGVVAYKVGVAAANVVGKVWNGLMKAKTVAMSLYTGSVKAATLATSLFNKVTKANVVGAIVSVITAAATAFATFRRNAERATDATKGLTEAKRILNDVEAESHRKADGELTRLKLLYGATQDLTLSYEKRLAAAKELIRLYPDTFKGLGTEAILAGKAQGAYDDLTASILRKAYVEAVAEKLKEVEGKMIDLELSRQYDENGYEFVDVSDFKPNFWSPKSETRQLVEEIDRRIDENEKKEAALQLQKNKLEETIRGFSEEEMKNLLGIVAGDSSEFGNVDFNLDDFLNLNGDSGGSNTTEDDALKTADAITAGGKGIRNFYINIDSLIGSTNNYFTSSKDDPASASDFMQKLSNALQLVVNDVNYIAD